MNNSLLIIKCLGRARTVVGNIWCVSAANQSPHLVLDTNSASRLKVD